MFLAKEYFQGKFPKYPEMFCFCSGNQSITLEPGGKVQQQNRWELNHLDQQYASSVTLYFENTPCLLCISALRGLNDCLI